MIIVKNRELLVPANERYLGTTYDNISENRQFLIKRRNQSGTDLSALNFRLDFLYANGSHQYDTITLVKTVNDEYITLTWPIREEILQVPGTVIVQIRAIDTENTVKWSTFQAAFYVERHLNTPGNYSGSLTEIRQMESDHEYMKRVINELKASLDYTSDAEAWAVGRRKHVDEKTGAVTHPAVTEDDETYHNNSKYYADMALYRANNASASAAEAANVVESTRTEFQQALRAVTQDSEVQNARIGADGTVYPVLKDRLDAEHTNVKTALTSLGGTESKAVTTNGSFAKTGLTTSVANRIRTDAIFLNAGDSITIENGSLEHACGVWDGSIAAANNVRNDNAFLTFTEDISAPYDLWVVVAFRKSANTDVSPAEFDGAVKVSRKITNIVDDAISDRSKYVDIDVTGKNLFNKNDSTNIKTGVYVDANTGKITTLATFVSCAMPIKAGQKISTTGMSGGHITFYSIMCDGLDNYPVSFVLPGYISGVTGQQTGYTVPDGAVQMVISFPATRLDTVQIEYGNEATEYAPYEIKPAVLTQQVIEDSGLTQTIAEVIYNIKADGSGDFANLRECLESITDASARKQYVINIYPGTYDIASLYDAYDVKGLSIPNYVTLRGVGDKHNIILTAVLDAGSTAFSTLNLKDICGLENLTVKSKNCRYTIHDDYQSGTNIKNQRKIKDCIFIGENCQYGSVYGSGLKGNAVWEFENCEFDATKSAANGTPGNTFSVHNNTNVTTPSFITFRNCRHINGSQLYKTFRLLSMTNGSSNGTVSVTLEGNKIDGIKLTENNASQYGAGCSFWVNGFGNVNPLGVEVSSSDGVDYSGRIDLI